MRLDYKQLVDLISRKRIHYVFVNSFADPTRQYQPLHVSKTSIKDNIRQMADGTIWTVNIDGSALFIEDSE